jgi:3-phosphoshikimate 1-carboxyvinyltransferase
VNPTRTGLLAVLGRMGADVSLENEVSMAGEPVADIRVEPGPLVGTTVRAAEIPALIDEVPVLAVLAARAAGETRVEGAAELRVKESDRIAVMVGNLRAVGASAEELPDGLVVAGADGPLHGAVRAFHDHRIAMAFGALGVADGCDIEVLEPGTADISFPGYWRVLAAFARPAAGAR